MTAIPFNKPYISGGELQHLTTAIQSHKLAGDGHFTFECQKLFKKRFNLLKCLLTTSCTDALEMSAILADIKQGDEVIMPSYTFVSTANAFVLRGAKVVFADSEALTPNMDVTKLEELITPKTKAIVPMHYAGIACDMDTIIELANKYNLIVIEDAAQAIDGFYKNKPLGGIGHFGTFSFHETKNIISGEGGLLSINDERFAKRAEIIREKGTNRSAFFRGEVDKYGWVDIGSSFLPSELTAAFLYAQLENIDKIQGRRKEIWERYASNLAPLTKKIATDILPIIPSYATINAHIFYLKCSSLEERIALINHLNGHEIKSVFHYLSLHSSPFYVQYHDGRELKESDIWTDRLVRLPLYIDLTNEQVDFISDKILSFYNA